MFGVLILRQHTNCMFEVLISTSVVIAGRPALILYVSVLIVSEWLYVLALKEFQIQISFEAVA